MRRDANRLLESTAEMVRAQIDELCQRSERYGLRQVLFDVSRNDTLLPRSKTAPRQPPRAPRIATSAKELARNHDCKRFTIALVLGAILDGSGQLDRGLPQHGIFRRTAGAQDTQRRTGCRHRSASWRDRNRSIWPDCEHGGAATHDIRDQRERT